jgi:arylsulfatase A-like enzyme
MFRILCPLFLLATLVHPARGEEGRPNVVLILTDNHGAWTLGCYGNRDVRTPHIDGLAREGTLLERCYASNGVCSPTRATLLTGLMPSGHGVHCYLRAGASQIGPDSVSTIAEFANLPRILSKAGYVCGLTGKWHLGGNLKPQEGFSYWVTMPHGATATFYDAEVIEGGKVRREPKYLTDFWTDHAVKFIEANRDRPFFLYLPYNGPYGLGRSLLKPAQNRHAAYYADKDIPSFPREKMHPWLFNNKEYLNNVQAIRRVAAEVSGVDDGVGRVLAALKKHSLEDNTLVIFTADQGWGGGQRGIWGMGDHTRPLHAFDDTMHVPLIFRHPGKIPANRRSAILTSNYDILPTLLGYLGLKDRLPDNPLPGRDYSDLLCGKKIEWEDVVYYEFENIRSVRTNEWKLILRRKPDGPDELYDLKNDPGERRNLIDDPDHAKTRQMLEARLRAFFARHANPRFDLWGEGKSKTPLLSRPRG